MSSPLQTATISGSGNIIVQAHGSAVKIERPDGVHLLLTQYESRTRLAAKSSSETALLSAYRADVVPMIGREGMIDELRRWLASEAIVSLRVLIGAGGRGKTRLALEFARLMAKEGWLAGFVEQAEFDRFRRDQNAAIWGWDKPTLIVIDYAASRAEQLHAWLRELADAAPKDGRPRLRILLLERQAQKAFGWLSSVVGQGFDDASRAVIEMLDPPDPVELPALIDPEVRHQIFSALLAHAPEDLQAPPLGADVEFDRLLHEEKWAGDPLYLMMAGLVAGERGVSAALSLSRGDLALEIGGRELERIGRIAKSRGVDAEHQQHPGALARHIAVLATLAQGLDLPAARALTERERERLGSKAATNATLEALGDASPAKSGIAPVMPDVVGEAAILLWLGGDGPIARWGLSPIDCVSAAAGISLSNVSQVVVRTAQDFAAAGRAEPIRWVEGLVAASDADIGALIQIADALPAQTLVLRELKAELHAKVGAHFREILRDLKQAPSVASEERRAVMEGMLALSLDHRSIALSALGRREEAHAVAKEAVEIDRGLAAARPDAFLPDLAASLDHLGIALSALGRPKGALAATEEAVELYRDLTAAQRDAFLPALAGSLDNLGNRLSALGRREEALAATKEAVELYRALAAAQPGAFLPDLAASLDHLGSKLSALGWPKLALTATEEAVELYRALAAAQRDAFLPDLAASLNNLSNWLSALGRRELALAAVKEAVELYRALAAAQPGAFLPDLALSLNNLGNRLSALGWREEALAAALEATTTLAPAFIVAPVAHEQNMANICRNYLNRCAELSQKPDKKVLDPIFDVFERLPEDPA